MSTLATSGSQRLTDTVTPGCSQLIWGTNGGARGANGRWPPTGAGGRGAGGACDDSVERIDMRDWTRRERGCEHLRTGGK